MIDGGGLVMASEWHKQCSKPKVKKQSQWLPMSVRKEAPLELTPEINAECDRLITLMLEDLKTGTSADLAWKNIGLYRYDAMYQTIKLHPRYITEVQGYLKERRIFKGKCIL